jgi:hypothetical protein
MHGFYYELLINDSLAKALEDKKEISFYYNYITNFCYYLFETKLESLSINEMQDFHELYCKKFNLSYNFKKVITTLANANLINNNGKIKITYKYVYYFFIAKQLTNNIHIFEIKELISNMCKRIHRDEYFNIIMFLTHLSKDEFIINELIKNASSLFEDVAACKLQDDIQPINNLVKELPKKIIEVIDTKDAREDDLCERDEIERLEREYDADKLDNHDINEDIDAIDLMSKMTISLKCIEILGQIAKKYWGEMTGPMKADIVSKTYFLGLRTLGFALGLVGSNKEAIINEVTHLVLKSESRNRNRQRLTTEIEESVGQYVFRLCYLSTFGIIKRISTSVGYDKLKPTFDSILHENPYNSIKLISLVINLDHFDSFPMKDVMENKKALDNNYLGYTVLQNLVINYLYMYDTDYKLKSRICNALGIEMKDQRFIDATSEVKRNS